jgi:uncharacterized iron-regulated membrane protein
MAENTQRNVWGLHGLTGFFIAVALLLSILAFLTVNAIRVQQATANQPYEIKNAMDIEKISGETEKSVVVHGAGMPEDGMHKYEFKN